MPVTEETYRRLSLEDPEGQWELVCGRLRQKPPMTHSHGDTITELTVRLSVQLARDRFRVRANHSRTQLPVGGYYIPDVAVVPFALTGPYLGDPGKLEAYAEPLPLVVEVWSPSTGDYDVTEKMAGYRERGDAEIWLVHPYDRTLTAWRRAPDGRYSEQRYTVPGVVEPASLPGVRVALSDLFG